jgi:hypothetical protein
MRKATDQSPIVCAPRSDLLPNIFEIPFNFESTLIIVSTSRVLIVFRGSEFSAQERPPFMAPVTP